MKTPRIVFIGISALCIFAFLAHTQTREPEHVVYTRYGWSFYLHGARFGCDLVRSNILASPSWSPSEPLPLSPDRAVEIARAELGRLVENESAWFPKEIILRCVGRSPPQDAYQAWYYGVRFEPVHPRISTNGPMESVVISVDFSGKPGVVKPAEPGR